MINALKFLQALEYDPEFCEYFKNRFKMDNEDFVNRRNRKTCAECVSRWSINFILNAYQGQWKSELEFEFEKALKRNINFESIPPYFLESQFVREAVKFFSEEYREKT